MNEFQWKTMDLRNYQSLETILVYCEMKKKIPIEFEILPNKSLKEIIFYDKQK